MRIDFLKHSKACFNLEGYFSRQLGKASAEIGISFREIYLREGGLSNYLFLLQQEAPDFTMSLSDIFPGERPPSEAFEVPHFFWNMGRFSQCLPYLDSPKEWIGYANSHHCAALHERGVMSISRILPGVDDLILSIERGQERFLDVVLFSPYVDLNALKKVWKEQFSPLLFRTLCSVAEGMGERFPYFEMLESFSMCPELPDLVFSLEEYQNALRTHTWVSSLKGIPLDLFGYHRGYNLYKHLPSPETTNLRWGLPYTEHFSVLCQAKILLIEKESPWILPAWACGCTVVHDPKDVFLLLDDPKMREALVLEKNEEMRGNETWSHRLQQIISWMAPLCG